MYQTLQFHLKKLPLVLDLTGCRPLCSNASFLFLACFFNLGASRSSTLFATRYTVEPTATSRGPRSCRERLFSIDETFLRLGLDWVTAPASSSSSLDESVRNSAGKMEGGWILSRRTLPPLGAGLDTSGTGSSGTSTTRDFLRSSACCLRRVSLS